MSNTYEVTLSFETTIEANSEEEAVRMAEKAASESGFSVSVNLIMSSINRTRYYLIHEK
jgi:hypothetical protein